MWQPLNACQHQGDDRWDEEIAGEMASSRGCHANELSYNWHDAKHTNMSGVKASTAAAAAAAAISEWLRYWVLSCPIQLPCYDALAGLNSCCSIESDRRKCRHSVRSLHPRINKKKCGPQWPTRYKTAFTLWDLSSAKLSEINISIKSEYYYNVL